MLSYYRFSEPKSHLHPSFLLKNIGRVIYNTHLYYFLCRFLFNQSESSPGVVMALMVYTATGRRRKQQQENIKKKKKKKRGKKKLKKIIK